LSCRSAVARHVAVSVLFGSQYALTPSRPSISWETKAPCRPPSKQPLR